MDPQQDGEIAGTIGKGLRIEAIKIDVAKYRYAYKYDAAGNLAYLQDVVNGVSYKYIYDLANRLVAIEDSKGNGLSYGYDANNQRSSYSEKIQGSTYGTNYSYDKDGKPKTVSYYRNNPINTTFNYDAIGRMDNKIINTGLKQYNTSYKYTEGVNGQTTTKVKSISNGIDGGTANTIAYTYDDNGNIKSITENGKIIIYDYNSLNELTREDNQVLNKTIVYDYDNGGNIKTKTEYEPCIIGEIGSAVPKKVYSYAYNDLIWKDKLSSYEGQGITYDAIGNPVSYNGYTYAWEAGRQLKSISKNGQTIGYKYNDAGIRTEKTVNEITTKYKLVGDKVTFESNGTDYMYYTYDSEDNLVSVTMNGAEYYYVRNAQGDIIGLIDINGAEVVSYSYDSWGKLLSITGTLKDTVGVKNPYRYRGYRYDTETQLYYLQSRYYNPEWGRFINADGIIGQTGELLGHNLFAYSKNNPINMSDPSGFRPEFTLGEETEEMVEASLAVMMTAVESRNNASVGQVEVVPTASLSNLSGTILGTSMGYVENISKKIVGYVGKDSVLQLLPPTSIAQTIQPYAKQAKFAAKAVTVVTAAFDIAHTWDSGTNLSLGQRVGKTALQVIGVGLGITVGTLVSGQLLAAGMATGGLLSVTGGILGAGAIDFLTGSLIGAGQDVIYKKYGLE